MLCIEIWSQDSTEHIEVSTTLVSPMQVWVEEEGSRIEVSAELYQGIEVTCRNVSEGIEISATFTPEMEVWTSYVCSLHDGDQPAPYLFIIPDYLEFEAEDNSEKYMYIYSNMYWIIAKETNTIE